MKTLAPFLAIALALNLISEAQALTLRKFSSDGTTLQYATEGNPSDPAVLFVHGFPDSHDLWRNQIPVLAEAGYFVLALDLRGFGGSELRPPSFSIQSAVDDLGNLLNYWGIDQATLVGHDIGGMLAWIFAGQNPKRVNKLVSFTVGHPHSLFRPDRPLREMTKSWYYGLFIAPGSEFLLPAQDWALFRRIVQNHSETERWIRDLSRPGALRAAMNWFRHNSLGLLFPTRFPSVTVPTLGILSDGDLQYVSERQMKESASFVQGAPFRIERISRASHWSMLDQPQETNRILLEFLRQ
jgi:pimeloyl-ACP methyl ester carboxylesterase